MSFSDIRDQAVPVRLLRNMIQRNRVPNGLLFWGPGGVGKRLAAYETAKAITCREHSGDACGRCLSCRKVTHGTHPDVKFLAPSGRGRMIVVDVIDFINDLASYRPFEGQWRVFILQDADRMGLPAQNHFLKTLEEPPSNTLFILLTEYPRLLLPTIRSRCQQVRFGVLRPETVVELLLRDRDLPRETAVSIAAVSQGQMSRALDLVKSEKRQVVLSLSARLRQGEDPLALSEEFAEHLRAQSDAIKAAVKGDFEGEEPADMSKDDLEEQKKDQVALAEALVRRDLMEYLYLLATWYRDEMVFAVTGDATKVFNRDHAHQFESASRPGERDKLAAVEKAWRYIERNLSIDRVFRDLFFVLAS